MDIVKIYQIEDFVKSYLKSWGYQDEVFLDKMITQFKKNRDGDVNIEDVISFFEEKILSYLNEKWNLTFSKDEKINYFKMLFLLNKGYEKTSIFEKITDEDNLLFQSYLQENSYEIAPDITKSNMLRQSIKTFHPVWKVKKTIVKSVQKILPNKKRNQNK